MAREGAIIFSDLIGKLDVLRVNCDKCGREGCYGLSRLIDKRGRDWLDELTGECPKKIASNTSDPVRCEVPAIAEGPVEIYTANPCCGVCVTHAAGP